MLKFALESRIKIENMKSIIDTQSFRVQSYPEFHLEKMTLVISLKSLHNSSRISQIILIENPIK